MIVPTKETYITSATCSKQAEREARERERERDREKDKDAGVASYQSVEIEIPTDILKKYLISKNAEVKKHLNSCRSPSLSPLLVICLNIQRLFLFLDCLQGDTESFLRGGNLSSHAHIFIT